MEGKKEVQLEREREKSATTVLGIERATSKSVAIKTGVIKLEPRKQSETRGLTRAEGQDLQPIPTTNDFNVQNSCL